MLRIALSEDTTRDAIDDVTYEAGLLLLNIRPATDAYPGQIIYTTRDRQTVIYLIEDARLDARYFVVQGSTEDAIAAILKAKLPLLPDADAAALAARMCG